MQEPFSYQVPAREIRAGDRILTEHGSNWGAFEVEDVKATTYPDGVVIVEAAGYQNVNAGICGPAERSYRDDERVRIIGYVKP